MSGCAAQQRGPSLFTSSRRQLVHERWPWSCLIMAGNTLRARQWTCARHGRDGRQAVGQVHGVQLTTPGRNRLALRGHGLSAAGSRDLAQLRRHWPEVLTQNVASFGSFHSVLCPVFCFHFCFSRDQLCSLGFGNYSIPEALGQLMMFRKAMVPKSSRGSFVRCSNGLVSAAEYKKNVTALHVAT